MIPALLSLALLAPAADPPKLSDAAEKELKALQGKWKIEKVIFSEGEKVGDEDVFVEFKGRRITAEGKEFADVTALDPATDPKCLDFKVLTKMGFFEVGSVYESIIKRDGDTLTWALYMGTGKKRPTDFEKPKEDGFAVVVLKRVKE